MAGWSRVGLLALVAGGPSSALAQGQALPALYWEQPSDTAAALRSAGIEQRARATGSVSRRGGRPASTQARSRPRRNRGRSGAPGPGDRRPRGLGPRPPPAPLDRRQRLALPAAAAGTLLRDGTPRRGRARRGGGVRVRRRAWCSRSTRATSSRSAQALELPACAARGGRSQGLADLGGRRRRLVRRGRADEPARAPQPVVPARGARDQGELPLSVELGSEEPIRRASRRIPTRSRSKSAGSSPTSGARCASSAARWCWPASQATPAAGGCTSSTTAAERSRACASACAGAGRRATPSSFRTAAAAGRGAAGAGRRDRVLAAPCSALYAVVDLVAYRLPRGARPFNHPGRERASHFPPGLGRKKSDLGQRPAACRLPARVARPCTKKDVVERVAVGRARAQHCDAQHPRAGRPVLGSMMCEYVTPSFSKKRA